jgi:hypothetical protein
VGFGLRERLGASRKQRNALSDREIYSLNISRLNQAAKALILEKIVERLAFAPQRTYDGCGHRRFFVKVLGLLRGVWIYQQFGSGVPQRWPLYFIFFQAEIRTDEHFGQHSYTTLD